MKKKKYGKLQTKENLIVFPGTAEKLIADGIEFAENGSYKKAVDCFDEAKAYTEFDETALTVYAYALFEIRKYDEAKEVCKKLLYEGFTLYEQIMELYLTILIEMKEFKEVDELLDVLIEEEIFSEEKKKNFEQLKELSMRISNEQEVDTDVDLELEEDLTLEREKYVLEAFVSNNGGQQHQLMYEASMGDSTQIIPELIAIVEDAKGIPIIKTLAILLLSADEVEEEVLIEKFGFSEKVIPVNLSHPTKTEKIEKVFALIELKLDQDPTKMDLAYQMITRHAFALFPFDFGKFGIEEIADTYVKYINHLFDNEQMDENELYYLINSLEAMYDLIDNV